MPVIRESIPEELKALMPDTQAVPVLVGRTCYELAPLPAGVMEKMAHELVELIGTVFVDIVQAAKTAGGKLPDSVQLAMSLKRGIEEAVKDGRAVKIVAVALDIPEELVRKEMTLPQMIHVMGALWKQNCDPSVLPEESRKNLESLLVGIGVRSQPDVVYQWADFALRILPAQQAGSPEERIKSVVQMAKELRIVEVNDSPTGVSTPTSPGISDTPSST